MDEKDFEILKILDKNCLISYSKIAERVNLSLRHVSNRIDALVEENIITRFTVQFDHGSLGYRHYIGSINLPNGQHRTDFFKQLQLIPEIYRIWEMMDGSLTISFFCKSAKHLEETINSVLRTGASLNSFPETRVPFPLDIPYSITDWQIIFYLLRNCRASKKSIADEISISEKTVNRRISRMTNMKLISFIPEINFEAITGFIPAIINLETKGPSKQIYLKIKNDSSIKYWRNVGSVFPSIVLFLYGKNLKEIYEMYLKLQDQKDIKSAHLTFVVRNYENSTLIEDAILEKIKNG